MVRQDGRTRLPLIQPTVREGMTDRRCGCRPTFGDKPSRSAPEVRNQG